MTSNIGIERDAALGRIFREMLEMLAKIERDWLDNPERKDDDAQELALQCLGCIGRALQQVKGAGQSPIDADHLPWPLFILMYGLHDVFKGRYSDLLTPITQGRHRPKGAPAKNTLKAQQLATAREVLSFLEKARWPLSKAASEIAAIFQKQSVKDANDKDITPATVLAWRKQSGRQKKTEAELILHEREGCRKALDDLEKIKSTVFTLDGVYRRDVWEETILTPDGIYDCYRQEECAFSIPVAEVTHTAEDRASIVLKHFRKFIAATSYKS